jgi:uncharacterized protein (DUF362 family)
MRPATNRREFLRLAGATAATAAAWPLRPPLFAQNVERPPTYRGRVVFARDEALTKGRPDEHRDLVFKLVDAAMQKLTGAPDVGAAWRKLVKPTERIGIKVNALGFTTRPVVADAIVNGLRQAGVPAENIVIWDRFDSELVRAGFKLNKSATGVQVRGTDGDHYGSGYQEKVETSGKVDTCFSKIVAEHVDALISVPVLKDHDRAGVTLAMKNFFGAFHNPNKFHDHYVDPYVVDVVQHPFIAKKWRLTILDGVIGQYHAGPGPHPAYAWPYGGLLIGTDYVAIDALGAEIVEAKRKEKGLKTLAEDNRLYNYIQTAASRGLGEADLKKIERIAV